MEITVQSHSLGSSGTTLFTGEGPTVYAEDSPGYLCILLGEAVCPFEASQSSGVQGLLLQQMLQKQDQLVWKELKAQQTASENAIQLTRN